MPALHALSLFVRSAHVAGMAAILGGAVLINGPNDAQGLFVPGYQSDSPPTSSYNLRRILGADENVDLATGTIVTPPTHQATHQAPAATSPAELVDPEVRRFQQQQPLTIASPPRNTPWMQPLQDWRQSPSNPLKGSV